MLKNFFSQDLKEGEEVVEIIRKHWGSFILSAAKILIAFFIPFFLLPFLADSYKGFMAFFVLFLIALMYAIHLWISWYNDMFIITNQRMININQKSLISKEVSEVDLNNIQGATYEISGVLAMMFNYGSVKIQASGINDIVEIAEATAPKDLQDRIINLARKVNQENEVSAQELIKMMGKMKNGDIQTPKDNKENGFKSKEIKS